MAGSKPACGKVAIEAGKRYPIAVTYFRGGSAAFWLEQVDLVGKGDLATITQKDKKFQYLIDEAGQWTVRNDVYFQEARLVEGGKPRGGHVWADFRDAFKDGKATIAVGNFPMNDRPADRFIPAGAPLSVWLEEMKIPPLGEAPTAGKRLATDPSACHADRP